MGIFTMLPLRAHPLTGKDQFVIATDKEMTNTELQVLIKHKAPLLKNEADYHTSLLQVLYNNMLSDRYAELLQKADVPYLDGSAGISSFMGDLNAYTASMVAKPGNIKDGFKLLWRTTEQVKRFGFTASELERAKRSFLSSYEAAYLERSKTRSKSYVKEYQENFLHGTASPGIETEHRIVIKNLNTISLAEINLISTEYIRNTNRDILLLAPDKEKANLPDEATVLNWIKEVEQEKIHPYVDKTSDLPFLATQPAGGKIISEQKDTALNITTLFLSNGLKVVLKPTTFKNNEVSFNLFGYGGSSLYADSDYQSASYATSIVASSGMGNYNPEQLNKYLEDKQVSMGPFITEREQGISGGSTTKDLETAMQAIYCYFTAPRKDEEIYKGLISRLKGSLINRNDDPNSVFSDTVRSVLSNNNYRRTGPSLEKIEKIDLNRSYEIFRDRFSDASNFTISFVGSFDEKKIRSLLEKYLASLPSTYKHEQAKDLGIHIPMGKITKIVYQGIENKASVKLLFSGSFDYSMAEKVKLDALKEILEIRLLERLREDESGVYSPGVSIGYEKYPHPNFSFMVSFGCAAENSDKLVASTLDEINKLRANGPLQINLDKYKAESRRSFELGVKTNSYWADYLNNQLQDQNDLHDTDKYLNVLESISLNDIKAIAQKYLSGDNYIKLELLPKTSNP